MVAGSGAAARALVVAAAVAVGAMACGSEGDSDDNLDAAGELVPGAQPDSLAATPSVPAGGQAGAGTAGDNTGDPRIGDPPTGGDSARAAARPDSSRLRVTPPDTVSRVPNPPPREARP